MSYTVIIVEVFNFQNYRDIIRSVHKYKLGLYAKMFEALEKKIKGKN